MAGGREVGGISVAGLPAPSAAWGGQVAVATCAGREGGETEGGRNSEREYDQEEEGGAGEGREEGGVR